MRKTRTRRALSAAFRAVSAAIVAVVALAGPAGAAAPAQPPGVAFAPAPCDEVVTPFGPISVPFDDTVECGWLTVPARHADPAGPTIELGVAVLKATGENPRPDPLFMAQGGPGASTIDSYGILLRNSAIRRDRDIVLFDQRGTRNTRPDLACTELDQLTLDTIETYFPPDEANRQGLEAAAACRTRLIREGVDLSAFDSFENAADVDALRQALGYDKINFYGVSYGTLLAQHVMRDFPGILRSAILDAVVPAATNPNLESGRSEDRALTELFAACQRDARCNAAYPDLERIYFETIARLNNAPIRVPMTDFETGQTYNAVVDGEALRGVVFQSLYATGLLPYLPYLIAQTSAGNTAALGTVASLFVFDRSIRTGMYYSMMCAEDADFEPADGVPGILRPEIAETTERDLKALVDVCRRWDVEQLGPRADEPVISDVPTLLLSGNFDPITPPPFAAEVAQGLSTHFEFTFPNTGHGAFRSSPCADQIVRAFLNDPASAPASACFDALGGVPFAARSDLLPLPVFAPLITLAPQVRAPLAIFGIGLLLLLSSWLLLPLAWLLRKLLKREGAPLPVLAKFMPWLVLLNALVLAAFAIALVGQMFAVASVEGDLIYLFGLPAGAWPIFMLPVISLILTVVIIAGTVAGWRAPGGWGWLRRIGRAGLAGAGVACLIALAMLGMLITPLLG